MPYNNTVVICSSVLRFTGSPHVIVKVGNKLMNIDKVSNVTITRKSIPTDDAWSNLSICWLFFFPAFIYGIINLTTANNEMVYNYFGKARSVFDKPYFDAVMIPQILIVLKSQYNLANALSELLQHRCI